MQRRRKNRKRHYNKKRKNARDTRVENMCVIYQIRHLESGKVYIGSTDNFVRRMREHKHALEKNKHINEHLQNAWNKFGDIYFAFEKINVGVPRDKRFEIEQYSINNYLLPNGKIDHTKCYNILASTGNGPRKVGNKKLDITIPKNLQQYTLNNVKFGDLIINDNNINNVKIGDIFITKDGGHETIIEQFREEAVKQLMHIKAYISNAESTSDDGEEIVPLGSTDAIFEGDEGLIIWGCFGPCFEEAEIRVNMTVLTQKWVVEAQTTSEKKEAKEWLDKGQTLLDEALYCIRRDAGLCQYPNEENTDDIYKGLFEEEKEKGEAVGMLTSMLLLLAFIIGTGMLAFVPLLF